MNSNRSELSTTNPQLVDKNKFLQAAKNGSVDVIKAYINANRTNPDAINVRSDTGSTALILAAGFGHKEVVSALLAAPGIDKTLKNLSHLDAEGFAKLRKHDEIVKLLHNAPSPDDNTNANSSRITPEEYLAAASNGDLETVKAYILTNIDDTDAINIQDTENAETALMLAATYGNDEVVALLLRTPGINTLLTNIDDDTAANLAEKNGFDDIDEQINSFSSYMDMNRVTAPHSISSHDDDDSIEENFTIKLPIAMIECPYTKMIFLRPVTLTKCGHTLERDHVYGENGAAKISSCPVCRSEIKSRHRTIPAYETQQLVELALNSSPALYRQSYFNLVQLRRILIESEINPRKLNNTIATKYLRILEHAGNHLNTAIPVLIASIVGRNILRQNKKIHDLIYPYHLEKEFDGKKLEEWLKTEIEVIKPKPEETVSESTTTTTVIAAVTSSAVTSATSPIATFIVTPVTTPVTISATTAAMGIFSYNNSGTVTRLSTQKLWEFVAKGYEDTPLFILRLNPQMIEEKNSVTDYSNRQIQNVTAFQVALITGDDALANKIIRMYVDELHYNMDLFHQQFAYVFDHGYAVHLGMQRDNIFNFDAIVRAISSAPVNQIEDALAKLDNDSDLCEAIKRFRTEFTTHSLNETIFNPGHLTKAFDILIDKYNSLAMNQRTLFWRQILGFVQCYMSANFAQATAHRIWRLINIENATPLVRSFVFTATITPEGIFPPDFEDQTGIGYDYAAADGGAYTDCPCQVFLDECREEYLELCSLKNASFSNMEPASTLAVDRRPSHSGINSGASSPDSRHNLLIARILDFTSSSSSSSSSSPSLTDSPGPDDSPNPNALRRSTL